MEGVFVEMTEDEAVAAHDLKEQIAVMLRDVVDGMLEGQTPEVEERIRMQLSDEMRFWK
jgi:hypothetical protein